MERVKTGNGKQIPRKLVGHWVSSHNQNMKLESTVDQIRTGGRLVYNDGRPGHQGVHATVVTVDATGMTVQFEDRADTSYIAFTDKGWMEHIGVVN